jgi:DNA polymerase I-like protein with 3'-5' exonuclease and polymerase domains
MLRNFCMQAWGAEILHVACVLCERRGIKVIATVHDALLVECAAEDVQWVSAELNRAMVDASKTVLPGFELKTDEKIIMPGEHFYDKRGAAMWEKVQKHIAIQEALDAEVKERVCV